MSSLASVRTGLDEMALSNFEKLKSARLGVIASTASVDFRLRHIVDLMKNSANCNVVRLFAPEHGVRGVYQAMEEVSTSVDLHTGIPVVSLYGSSEGSLTPKPETFEDLDVVVVDMQDIGSRYYTYAQTLCFAMRTAQKTGTKILVLDRPNPINGEDVEGSPLCSECKSFCGQYPVANRHGMTIGELAMLMHKGFCYGDNAVAPIPCELEIVCLENWSRRLYADEINWRWVQPSPNIPSVHSAVVYPGACLFEATNISEGRGTTQPFELLGAPFIDGRAWAEETLKSELQLEGAILRPVSFMPQFDKYKGKICDGIQIHVVDRERFKPFRWALALIATAARMYPDKFIWRQGAYEFIEDVQAIDLLFGSNEFRKCVERKTSLAKLLNAIAEFEAWFRNARQEFLLY
ncbi:MAG: DUF1343 domain-containing protein [Deltaproteobacteria bacterium]|nr:DUF1343 domain-containing protein [Deltaproteobacteria bacterium]